MNNKEQLARMKELTELLDEAARVYEQENRELMSNYTYDKYYDELLELEKATGTVLAGSPTAKPGYEVLSELPKEAHEEPMLSLDKTKQVEALEDFLGEQKALLSWKLDGLTIVLTYRDGKLFKAVTRGNGEVGEVITNNARVFKNIPLVIPFQGEFILRGEAVIRYSDFEKMNEQIEDVDAKYKNPRNLCSGSVRQLNNEITAKRNVYFYAFALIQAENVDFSNSRRRQFEWMHEMGFDVVEHKEVTKQNVAETVEWFREHIAQNDFPSDGLVMVYDDIAYGKSLGRTSKFPRDAIAFKWADEIKQTRLLSIEWSPSRTGLINPIAVFEPVELEGTTVSRASLHNISIMKGLALGIGDTVEVYKANMIIPQIAENLTRSGVKDIPDTCPVCGGRTQLKKANDAEVLCCTNPACQAKKVKAFALLASRDALNIEGLSEATLEKFIDRGYLKEPADLFYLEKYKEDIISMEGFGEKSYQNLTESIERARKTILPKYLYSLGIPNVGLSNAKLICRAFSFDLEKIKNADAEEFAMIDGIGEVIAESMVHFFAIPKNRERAENLLKELVIEVEEVQEEELTLKDMVFVVTGSLNHFENRNELKDYIEKKGGKVTGSVTGKTNYLINNDTQSNSTKNKKAKELNIPILSEEDFINTFGGK